ncbi:MAG: hypothetical protein ABW022_07240 [Actinoplanes sp.]
MPARKTPLKAGKGLERAVAWGLPERAASTRHRAPRTPKRRTTGSPIPTKVRAALAVRSEGKCEIAASGCTGVATEAAHRVRVGMGGRKGAAARTHHVLSNLLHLDHHCHQQLCHANPAAAYDAGWMLREHQTPLLEPVLYRGERRWLADDGSTSTTPPTEEVR